MCGIAGIVSTMDLPAKTVVKMTNRIRHRGPDDEGFILFREPGLSPLVCGGTDTPVPVYVETVPYAPSQRIDLNEEQPVRLALGHRRLSIVDLSPLGHQPMCCPDSRYWIVFNGEVYNHIELRQELEREGYRFRSCSDTEVVLAAYDFWGEDCLSRFNGMWGLAIYDRRRQTLFLARDRFGVKPLYYWHSLHGLFAFASEIKQFVDLPGWVPGLNAQRTYDYLAFGLTDHSDETLFQRVFQVPPGHYALVEISDLRKQKSDGRIDCQKWYNLAPLEFKGTFDDAVAGFQQYFTDAVRLRLRADVPVGSCLSGGLDSSSIVCVMNRLLHEQNASSLQKTFSACSEVPRFDERKWIDIVVNTTGVDAHYIYPSIDSLFDESPNITWHQDEPFGSTSIYAQWNVFRLAREAGIKVMLDGQGADEQLAGYHGYFGAHLASLLKQFRWLDLLDEVRALKKNHGFSPYKSAKYLGHYVLPDNVAQQLKRLGGYAHARPAWLDWERLGAVPRDPFAENGARRESVQALSIAQLTSTNLQMLLHWEDRDSMAHSIESRVPFLDFQLVEFVLGLPDEFKLSKGVTKSVLREAMIGSLPEEIRTRMDKLGFVTPEEVWLKQNVPNIFRLKLEESIEVSAGILKAESLEFFEDILTGRRKFSSEVWRMVNFGDWLKTYTFSL